VGSRGDTPWQCHEAGLSAQPMPAQAQMGVSGQAGQPFPLLYKG